MILRLLRVAATLIDPFEGRHFDFAKPEKDGNDSVLTIATFH